MFLFQIKQLRKNKFKALKEDKEWHVCKSLDCKKRIDSLEKDKKNLQVRLESAYNFAQ